MGFSRNVIGMCTIILFNKRLSIPCTCVDPLVRNGRDTRVQRHVDVPQKTSDRQIASARLRRTKQVSGKKKKTQKVLLYKNTYSPHHSIHTHTHDKIMFYDNNVGKYKYFHNIVRPLFSLVVIQVHS